MTKIDRESVERLAEYLSPDVKRILLALRAALDEAEARVKQAAQEARAAALQEAAEVAKAWWSPTMSQGYEQAGAILALLDTPAAEALERVRAEEREACAQVAEAHKPTQSLITNSEPNGYWRGVDENAFSIAAAIRARG